MPDRRGLFTTETPDSRPLPQPIDAPVTSGEIVSSHWTLTRQDFAGAPLQAEVDAYGPIVTELMKRDRDAGRTNWLTARPYVNVDQRSGNPVNTDLVWQSITEERQRDPNFLSDLPAKNAKEFAAFVQAKEQGARRKAQDVVSRERGLAQSALGFGTDIVSSFVDPINLSTTILTGGVGAGRTLLSIAAREALINGSIEAIEQPVVAQNRQQFGETLTPGEAAANIGLATIAGGLFPVAAKGAGAVGGKVGSLISQSEIADAAKRGIAIADLYRQKLRSVSDEDVLSEFARAVPPEVRTPDQVAAMSALERHVETARATPFADTPGGGEVHAARLDTAHDLITRPVADASPITPRPVPRATEQLTQDRIIRFVLNDLEGGGKLVDNGDGAGLTKYGVTERFNPDVDVRNLTEEQATQIARQRYWLPEFNTADPRIAAIAFDAHYIGGPGIARRILREAGDDPARAIDIYRQHLADLADKNPAKAKFRKGWMNRVDKLAALVGDAEPGHVRLNADEFDDTASYQVAQAALNAEEMQIKARFDDRGDGITDYVDRYLAGDLREDAPDAQQWRDFAEVNRDAIDAELQRRETLGTDAAAPFVEPQRVSDAEALAVVRTYAEQTNEPLRPDVVAQRLDIPEAQVRTALDTIAASPELDIVQRADGAYTRARGGNRATERTPIAPSRSLELLDNYWRRARENNLEPAAVWGVVDPASNELVSWHAAKAAAQRTVDRLGNTGDLRVQRLRPSDLPEIGARNLDDVETPGQIGGTAIDKPTDPAAMAQIESTGHDLKILAEQNPDIKVRLDEDAEAMPIADVLKELDDDDAAIETIRGCL